MWLTVCSKSKCGSDCAAQISVAQVIQQSGSDYMTPARDPKQVGGLEGSAKSVALKIEHPYHTFGEGDLKV